MIMEICLYSSNHKILIKISFLKLMKLQIFGKPPVYSHKISEWRMNHSQSYRREKHFYRSAPQIYLASNLVTPLSRNCFYFCVAFFPQAKKQRDVKIPLA